MPINIKISATKFKTGGTPILKSEYIRHIKLNLGIRIDNPDKYNTDLTLYLSYTEPTKKNKPLDINPWANIISKPPKQATEDLTIKANKTTLIWEIDKYAIIFFISIEIIAKTKEINTL